MRTLKEFLNEEDFLNEGKEVLFHAMSKQGKAFIYKTDDGKFEFKFPEGYTLDINGMKQLLKTLERGL